MCAGNHDIVFQRLMAYKKEHCNISVDNEWLEEYAHEYIPEYLRFPDKLVYLQDSSYWFEDKLFYGSPWCPALSNWAFYKSSSDLINTFGKIPNKVDVLITHTPGSDVFDTGISTFSDGTQRHFGSKELSSVIFDSSDRQIGLWLCGHIHSGNHNVSTYNNGMKVVNVSLIDEDYKVAYEPFVIEI